MSEREEAGPAGFLAVLLAGVLKAPIHLYRWTIKPWMGLECRHLPTCSEYGLEAIDTNGAWRGFWLTLSRILRCNPWGSAGYDPPPDIRSRRHPFTPWRYGRWTGAHIEASAAWRDRSTHEDGGECGDARCGNSSCGDDRSAPPSP